MEFQNEMNLKFYWTLNIGCGAVASVFLLLLDVGMAIWLMRVWRKLCVKIDLRCATAAEATNIQSQ